MLIVATDHLGEVQHDVRMSVDVLHLSLIEGVAYISLAVGLASLLEGRIPSYDEALIVPSVQVRLRELMPRPARESLDLVAVSSETHTDTRSEPLTEVSLEVRSKAINELHLAIVITEVHLGTSTNAEEPVTTEVVRLDLVLASVLDLYSVDGVGRALSPQPLSKE